MDRKNFLSKLTLGVVTAITAPKMFKGADHEVITNQDHTGMSEAYPVQVNNQIYSSPAIYQVYSFPAVLVKGKFYTLGKDREVDCGRYKKFATDEQALHPAEQQYLKELRALRDWEHTRVLR